LLLGNSTRSQGDLEGISEGTKGSIDISEFEARIKEKDSQIEEKNFQIETLKRELLLGDLKGSIGDSEGFAENLELKARIEEKDKQIEEKEKHIETLKRDIENSQETHRNYMMQMQTLITQKQIESIGVKKPWWRFW
jgi:predicted RNase H-like nuclease (RuvC/YqgF family)